MIEGSACWSQFVQRNMESRILGGRRVCTFSDLPQSLYHGLANTARRLPNAVAIVDDNGNKMSFSELVSHVDTLAWRLSRLDVGRGDRVCLLMHADVEFAETLFAASRLGAVCVPIPTKCRAPEIASLMRQAGPAAVIAGGEFEALAPTFPVDSRHVVWSQGSRGGFALPPSSIHELPDADGEAGPEDPVVMLFTSGTTARSKGVVLRNYNVCHAAEVYARLMGTTSEDRCLIPVPIYHVTGLIALLVQFMFVGGTVYLHRRFDARRVLETVRDEGITYLHAAPTAFAKLLPLRSEFPSLPGVRAILSGSSYEPVSAMRAFHEWMPTATFKVVYGMTETSSPALLFPHDAPTSIFAGATGKPVPGVDARIIGEDGIEVPEGEVGELQLRGACVMEGYVGDAAGGPDSEGWLSTGDMARANDEGMVWVVGRKKEMVNRGGEKVWCSALEEVICELPEISECCVTGIPDELYGEVPVAAVVAAPGASPTGENVRRALSGRVARYKIPALVLVVASIPETRGGKPDRGAVRDLAIAAQVRKEMI